LSERLRHRDLGPGASPAGVHKTLGVNALTRGWSWGGSVYGSLWMTLRETFLPATLPNLEICHGSRAPMLSRIQLLAGLICLGSSFLLRVGLPMISISC
jgi:hypothetical protein